MIRLPYALNKERNVLQSSEWPFLTCFWRDSLTTLRLLEQVLNVKGGGGVDRVTLIVTSLWQLNEEKSILSKMHWSNMKKHKRKCVCPCWIYRHFFLYPFLIRKYIAMFFVVSVSVWSPFLNFQALRYSRSEKADMINCTFILDNIQQNRNILWYKI